MVSLQRQAHDRRQHHDGMGNFRVSRRSISLQHRSPSMRYAILACALFWIGIIGCVYQATHITPLPHRPVTVLTNFGQGNNPGKGDCPPSTIGITVEGFFLACLR